MKEKEAIAYIQEWLKDEYTLNSKDREVLNMAIKAIKALKQEPLTDVEQRLFLSAMSREEKICKKLCSGGDGINLVPVCYRIKRKVKKTLWG